MTYRQTDGPAVSAAKAAISTLTAYRSTGCRHRGGRFACDAVPIRSPSSWMPRPPGRGPTGAG